MNKKSLLLCTALITAPLMNAASPCEPCTTCDQDSAEQWYNLGRLCLASASFYGVCWLCKKYKLFEPTVGPFGNALKDHQEENCLSHVRITPFNPELIVRMDPAEMDSAPQPPIDSESLFKKSGADDDSDCSPPSTPPAILYAVIQNLRKQEWHHHYNNAQKTKGTHSKRVSFPDDQDLLEQTQEIPAIDLLHPLERSSSRRNQSEPTEETTINQETPTPFEGTPRKKEPTQSMDPRKVNDAILAAVEFAAPKKQTQQSRRTTRRSHRHLVPEETAASGEQEKVEMSTFQALGLLPKKDQ